MKTIVGFAAGIVAFLVLSLGITWLVAGNDFFLFRFFAPRQEAVRREVFKQSQAYNDGMQSELDAMRFEYVKTTDPKARAAMASVILHRVSSYDTMLLTPDLRNFIETLRHTAENDMQ